MIIYFAKFILCSGLFFIAYILLFEKEKALHFKRFYLLISLVLSLTIPLLTFENSSQIILKGTESYLSNYIETPVTISKVEFAKPQETNIYPSLILAIYVGISLVLLGRFCRNFYKILAQKNGKAKATYNGTIVILIENIITPYSFLNYIFVNKTEFEHNQIAEEILLHELTHARQKHSLDVIFIELLHVFLWFNPMLYFYRKAIQTNHEYLADENVIQTSQDIPTYQMLLLNHISTQCGLTLTSQFNYLTIKKRLTMMTKTNSMRAVLGKQLLLIPVLGIALFLFSTKTEAQDRKEKPTVVYTANGLNETEHKEYNALVDKFFGPKGNKFKGLALNKTELARIEALYYKMSKEQQSKVKISFVPILKPMSKRIPTSDQLSAWLDTKKFGIYLDGKKIDNSKLSEYKNTDFSLWAIGRLTKKSANYGKFDNEVYLKTNAKYQAYADDVIKNPKSSMHVNEDPSHPILFFKQPR